MINNSKLKFYPLLLDISDYNVLIAGGGKVALRKLSELLQFATKKITLISPSIITEIQYLIDKSTIKYEKREYKKGDALGCDIVFAATDNPGANQLIANDCSRYNIFLNIADSPSLCNFILPANIHRGDFLLSLSCQGKAPFLVKHKKNEISEMCPASLSQTAKLAESFRNSVLSSSKFDSHEKKSIIFNKFLKIDWDLLIIEYGLDKAKRKMKELLEE